MSDQPLQPRKTKFQYTTIPNTAQYKWSNWDGHRVTSPGSTLVGAKESAENDPSISYFFHMRGSMYLEPQPGKTGTGRTFTSGDASFFSGENLWLGSAPGTSDTYLVDEQYDMSDKTTRDDILNALRANFLNGNLDASTGTKENPKLVKAGWVFVDFKDVKGGSIAPLRSKLEGPKNASGVSALEAFISKESNGRVKLVIETHKDTGEPAWVTLPLVHTTYENNFPKIAAEVDKLIEYPDDWDIVMFAFPDVDPDPADGDSYEEGSGFWISHSQCIGGQLVDKDTSNQGQTMQYTFMDPLHYNDKLGAHITTIHEVMHAFRLPDLYYSDTNRSYGWSMMSAAGAGCHITQFEKLLLGWEDPEKFIFLKRGMIPADDLLTNGDKKGIVILPGEHREDTYFIEVAQEIGVGESNRTEFNKENKDDYGLLLMIVRKDQTQGRIIPYVCERPADARATEQLYGGASKAPFKKLGKFSTNGIFSFQTYNYPTDDGKTVSRIVGVDGAYKPSDQARFLRENDRIVLNDEVFMMTTTGALSFGNNSPCLNADGSSIDQTNLCGTDYGYTAFIDKAGVFHVAKSVDDKPTPDAILMSFPTPSTSALSEGNYFFRLEKIDGETTVGVYKEGIAERQYTLFHKPQITRKWEYTNGRCKIRLNEDGNLVVVVDGDFAGGSIQEFNFEPEGKPAAILFDEDGTMRWLNELGKEINRFPKPGISSKTGTGPFTLDVSDPQADKGSLVVVDAGKNMLYEVFDYDKAK